MSAVEFFCLAAVILAAPRVSDDTAQKLGWLAVAAAIFFFIIDLAAK